MDPLNHWYPVLPVAKLGRRPVRVTLWDRPIVLFRTASGVAALDDVCPHRGTPLSKGHVEDGKIVCPYHGLGFDAHGLCATRRKVKATAYEVEERHGAIWLKNAGLDSEIPACEFPSHRFAHGLRRVVPAPLELLVDNFVEIEHTGTAHWAFGFPQTELDNVQLTMEDEDWGLRATWVGPQKPAGQSAFSLVGVRPGDQMRMVADTRFGPLNVLYDISWHDPKTGEKRPFSILERAFFARTGPGESLLYAFYNVKYGEGVPWWVQHILKRTMPWLIRYEYYLDRKVLQAMDPERIDLRGYRLGRLDAPVIAHRRRMEAAGLMAKRAPIPRKFR